jgi:hypothetical protein
VDLLALFEVAGTSTLKVTVVAFHVVLYVTSAVTLGDDLRVGFLVMRLSDIGAGVTGSVDPATPELDWVLWKHEFAAPTYAAGGANVLEYHSKTGRRIRAQSETFGLALGNPGAAAKTIKVSGRTLLRLP